MMGHDDFRCNQFRILHMADHLGRCLNAQLDGIYIHGCEGRCGEPGKQGIIKGKVGRYHEF